MQAEVSIRVGVVVERLRIDNRWAQWSWRPVAVFTDAPEDDAWRVLVADGDVTRFHAGNATVTLHRKLVEAYRVNLARDAPSLWVVLRDAEEADAGDMPYAVAAVTASPYEAQDYADSGEGLIEPVPVPPELLAWLVDFVRAHPAQEEFKKRKRDKLRIEEQKFGKEPIFKRSGNAPDQS
ncbi:DUF3305 domain-containing protein [Breoghania sp. L-A4]|uniref:DUF3305 domain-containing protein n=1 Tax=Breoghania sp. L-A4 TaxID=2304600 RepID=UPI0013C32438|nr:DUF3305 domain-containing protein [Breoghania sp. L-A4]